LKILICDAGEGRKRPVGIRSISYSQEGKEYPTYNKRREAIWISHILRRDCLLKHVSEGKTEGTGRWGRRRNQLLDYLRETIRH
jgi:hypothetical protein